MAIRIKVAPQILGWDLISSGGGGDESQSSVLFLSLSLFCVEWLAFEQLFINLLSLQLYPHEMWLINGLTAPPTL